MVDFKDKLYVMWCSHFLCLNRGRAASNRASQFIFVEKYLFDIPIQSEKTKIFVQ